MINIKVGENTGGKEAIHRLLIAYNFKSRQQLCDHLGASKSTMANRYLRDSFPAEWVIQCALETGTSLLWLATGQGEPRSKTENKKDPKNDTNDNVKRLSEIVAPEINKAHLIDGMLKDQGKAIIDSELLPSNVNDTLLITTADDAYIVDLSQQSPVNGSWLVEIDGLMDIVKLMRIPGNRLHVQQDAGSFECSIDDVNLKGRIIKVIKSL